MSKYQKIMSNKWLAKCQYVKINVKINGQKNVKMQNKWPK